MNGIVTVLLDEWRMHEFNKLTRAMQQREPELDLHQAANEVFALGIQAAWLRLSKGEHILPPEVAG